VLRIRMERVNELAVNSPNVLTAVMIKSIGTRAYLQDFEGSPENSGKKRTFG
jgi:hypothetical protein